MVKGAVIGLLLILFAGFAARDWIIDQWWVWQLHRDNREARYAALDALIERGSLRALPYMLEEAHVWWQERRYDWPFVVHGVFSCGLVELCWRDRAKALPILRSLLDSTDPILRREAVGCLYAAASSLREDHLPWRDGSNMSHVSRELKLWFGEHGNSVVVPLLVDMLSDPDSWTRQLSMETLEELGPLAYPQLYQLLEHTDPWVRAQTALILIRGTPRREDTVRALLQQLEDTDDDVRLAAAANLGALRTRLPGIVDTLASTILDDQEREEVKIAAAKSLFEIVQRSPVSHQGSSTPGTTPSGELAEPLTVRAVSTLAQALKDDSRWVRLAAVRWLGWFGKRARAAAPALEAATRDPDPEVREAVVKGLEDIQIRD